MKAKDELKIQTKVYKSDNLRMPAITPAAQGAMVSLVRWLRSEKGGGQHE